MQDLSSFHTFHIAVRARKIIEVFSLEQLQQAWQTATAKGRITCRTGKQLVVFRGF